MRRGDAFLHNSPYHGNSHAADWCVVDPGRSTTTASTASRCSRRRTSPTAATRCRPPTSPTRRDVYDEGALIFPCVKVQEDYREREDVLRMARVRIRVPDHWYGDFLALLGAARIGERRLLELDDEVGWEHARAHTSATGSTTASSGWSRRSGACRQGRVTREGRHDPFPGMPDGFPSRSP